MLSSFRKNLFIKYIEVIKAFRSHLHILSRHISIVENR